MRKFEDYENIALIDDSGRKITYKELDRQSDTAVNPLNKGDLALLVCTNTIECVEFYIGCIRKEIVVMLIEAKAGNENIEALIHEYQPNYVFAPSNMDIELNQYNIMQDANNTSKADANYILYKNTNEIQNCFYKELALLLPTSGSTGSKKFVRLSRKNLRSNAESIIEYLKMDETEIPILHLPISYSYGLSVLNTTLMVGGTVVLTEKSIMSKHFWEMFNEYDVTTFVGVPFHYEMIKKLHIYKKELKSLKVMTQAGGKLREDLQVFFGEYAKEKDIRFYVMYGQTEATARMAYLPHDVVLKKVGSVGFAIPGGTIRIIDENNQEIIEPLQVGELVYEGKNVSLGYASDREELAAVDLRKGILHTGDLGYKDEEGYIHISGRKNRIGKYFGKRIQLDDVENMLKKKVGYEIALNMMDNHIYVVSDETMEQSVVSDVICEYTGMLPQHIKCLEGKIPRKANGKISYNFGDK